jgi:hypothetical protein
MVDQTPWIGVDLDGTLSEYTGWSPIIGPPVPKMMERLYKWLHTPGIQVKIFTARATMGDHEIQKVKDWLWANGLPKLEVTATKDMFMVELWDDRAIQVIKNTGIAIGVRE